MNGTIKKLIAEKGFGFIAIEGQKDVFFHKDALNGLQFEDLKEGDAVTFEVVDGQKGQAAKDVKRV